jgi:hypothetical protein
MVEEDSTSPKEQMRGVRVRGFGVVQSGGFMPEGTAGTTFDENVRGLATKSL